MQKFLRTLTFMALLCVPWVMQGQVEVYVGDPELTTNGSNTYLPANSLYEYSYTQQIYTADEIGMGGTINSITLWLKGNADLYTMPFTIYMVETDKASFSSNTDWETVTANDIVCTQTVTVHNTDYEAYTFELETPFTYSGASNLLIAVKNDCGQWKSGLNGMVFGETGDPTLAIYARQDGTPYDPYTPTFSAYGTTHERNVILFDITPGGGSGLVCNKPQTLEVSDVTTHGATFTWENTEAASYTLEYKASSATDFTVISDIRTNTYTLTNLAPGTNYSVKVKAVCGTDNESGYKSANFQTMFGIPLIEPFGTTSIPAGWAQYSGLIDDVLAGTANLTSGSSWYFGTNNGVFDSHARVNIYGTSCKYWLVTPTLEMENNVELSFELALTAFSGNGAHNSNCPDDRFVVLIYTESDSSWTVLREYNNSGSQFVYNNLSTTPTDVAIDLSAYAGQNIAIAFYGESTESNADNNLHIDNVSINYIPSCPKPTDVMASNISGHTADISWHANADSYLVEYRIATDSTWLSTTPATNSVTLTGLAPETNYKVRVTGLCGNDTSMTSRESSFTTDVACPAPDSLAVVPTDTSAVVTWHDTFNQAWKIRLVSSNIAIDSADVTETTTTFYQLTPGAEYQVVVIADCSEANDSLSVAATLAFSTLESCPAPELTVTNVTDSSATVHIGEDILGVIQSYVVTVMKGQEIVEGYEDMAVNDTVFPITGLDELSTYTVKVASVCGEDATSEYGTAPFTTKERCPAGFVCLGSGTSTNDELPMNCYYKYALSQQIYTADELGITEPKDIVSVDLHLDAADTRNLDIYMLSTSKSAFASNTDWFVVDSNTTPLFSGSVTFTANDWTTIEFTNPFYYNNTDSNIVLIIDDNNGSYSSNHNFYVYTGEANQSLRIRSDGTNYNPFAPGSYSGTRAAVKNRVRFGTEVHSDCRKPSNLAAVEIGPDNIKLQWTENGLSDSWTVAYLDTLDAIGQEEPDWLDATADTIPFTLEGLTPVSTYLIKVRPNCSDGLIKWSDPIQVTTLVNCPVPTDLAVVDSTITAHEALVEWNDQYGESFNVRYGKVLSGGEAGAIFEDDFENGLNNWTIYTEGESAGAWRTIDPTSGLSVDAHSGSYVASAWSWNNDAIDADNWLVTPQLTLGGTLTYWVGTNAGYPDSYEVKVSTTGNAVADFTTTVKEMAVADETWTEVTIDLSAFAGQNGYIAFHHVDYDANYLLIDDVSYSTSTFEIDDETLFETTAANGSITLEGLAPLTRYMVQVQAVCSGNTSEWSNPAFFTTLPSCWPVDSLHIAARTTESITLAWTSDARNEVHETLAYIILDENGEDSYSIEAGDTPEEAIVTDLDPNTEYTFIVMTDCGNEDLSTAVRISARTACEAIDEIPATYNFENDSIYCWTIPQPENADFLIYAEYAHSDSTFLVLQGSSATDTVIAAMPHFTTADFDPDGIMVSFYARTLQSSGHLQVGTMSDLEDTNTFVLTLDTNITSTEYGRIDASLDWEVPEEDVADIHVVFRLLGNGICLIDDVTLAEPSECQYVRADSIHVDSITGHTAMVTWGDILNEEGTTYTIYYMDGNERGEAVNSEPITLETLPYLMTGLEGQTEYNFIVVASCGEGYESDPTPFGFTTQTTCFPPTNLAIELVNGNGSLGTLTWTSDSTVNTWEICLNGDMEELIPVTDSAVYSFENLIPDTINTVKVRALCGDEEGTSLWSNVLSFETSSKVIVGTAASTNDYLPTYTFFNYSLTQQIYTAEELGDAGALTSIDFRNTSTSYSATRNLDIYIVSTNKSSFSGSTDWITVTDADKVFSGSVTFNANSWKTITFNTPFIYDGTSNVAIIVDDNTGSYVSSPSFAAFNATSQAIRIYSDGTNYNPASPSSYSGTVLSVKNHIRLGKEPINCWPVADLTATEVGATNATLTWTADAFDYAISIGDSVMDDVELNIHGDTVDATVNGLLPEHTYTLTVKAICEEGISFGKTVTFTTQPSCLQVDSLVATEITDTSVVLTWHNPAGAENFIVMNGEEEFTTNITFNGNSATITGLVPDENHTLTVYAMCSTEDTAHGTNVTFRTLPSCHPADSLMVSDTAANSVVLSWVGTGSSFAVRYTTGNVTDEVLATSSPYTLDNLVSESNYTVSVYTICGTDTTPYAPTASFRTLPSCYPVDSLKVTNITGTTAVLTWESDAPAFAVWVDSMFVNATITEPTYTVTGLAQESQHTIKVYSICDGDDTTKTARTITFATGEDCPEGMACIGTGTATNSFLPTYNYFGYSLSQQIYTAEEIGEGATILSVAFYNSGTEKTRTLDVYMVSTTKDTFASQTDWIPVTAADKLFSGSVTFTAGAWNTITFTSPFIYDGQSNVALIVDDNSGAWSSSPHMSNRVFTAQKQALYKYQDGTDINPTNVGTLSGTVANIKNRVHFGLGAPITCLATVDSLQATEVTATGAVLTWTSEDAASVVVYDGQQPMEAEISGNNAILSNLTPEHTYNLTVKAICANSDLSFYASNVTFTTLPTCLPVDSLMATQITDNSAVVTWQNPGEAQSFIVMMGDSVLAEAQTTTSYELTNLEPETNYAITVYAVCSQDDTAHPVTMTFTTNPSCLPVQNLTVEASGSTAVFTWESEVGSYIVMNGNVVLANVNENTYTMYNLVSEANYTISVYAACSTTDTSYANSVSFTAPVVCPENMICVGDSTATNNYLPTFNYYNYSLSQQIYTADELDHLFGSINSVEFYNAGAEKTRNIDVYMVSTTKDTFASQTDWIEATAANLVFSGEVTFTANEWTTINFTTPFNYNGRKNVALIVDDNTGDYTYSPHMACRVLDAPKQTLYRYYDNTDFDPADASVNGSGTIANVKNRVRFGLGETPEPLFVTVNVNPAEGGIVEGEYGENNPMVNGDVVVLNATAAEGYRFVNWTANNDVLGTDNILDITVTSSMDITANFELIPTHVVTYSVNPENAGEVTVSGAENLQAVIDGTEVSFTATAAEGYEFVNWTAGEQVLGTDATIAITVTSDTAIVANFNEVLPTFSVTVSVNDATMGSVTSVPETLTDIEWGTEVTLTATATEGYRLTGWTVNGEAINAINPFTFTVTDTMVIVANFDVIPLGYTVTVTYDETMGTVTGIPTDVVAEGTEVTLTATPAEGYRFVNWTIDNEEVDNQLTYTFAVETNVDIVANFEALEPGVTYDTVNAAPADATMGSVTASVTLGQPVAEGTEVTLTAVPATCYNFVAWMENNEEVSTDAEYTFTLDGNRTLVATFEAVETPIVADEPVTTCDSYVWNGQTYTASEELSITLTGANGCDSIATLSLTINNSVSTSVNETACDSYEWNGETYTTSGVYTYTTAAANGCDSVVTLNLTINNSVSVSIEATAEGSYEWNGETYTESGSYTYSTVGANGCDSTTTLVLTITEPQTTVTVTFTTNNANLGTTNPAPGTYTYNEGDTIFFDALPTEGNSFEKWVINYGGEENDTLGSYFAQGYYMLADTMLAYGITNMSFNAFFKAGVDSIEVTYAVNDATMGTITPSGVQMLAVGQQLTASATANEGFELYAWRFTVYLNGTVIRDTVMEMTQTEINLGVIPQLYADYGATLTITAMFRQNVGIDDVDMSNVSIYSANSTIYVKGAEGQTIHIYDLNGRTVVTKTNAAETMAIPMGETGVYLVRVGNAAAKRVMLMR